MVKKITVAVFMVIVWASCSSIKKGEQTSVAVKPIKITFDTHIKSLVVTKCGPCHLDTGDEISYDNFTSAKENINDIIRRIKLKPEQHGFMPQKKPRLSDSLIHVFEQWKVDSLLEK